MARNKVNLKMQMLQKLDSQAAFGVKKQKEIHGCDKQYNSNRNVNGIASYKTMEKYRFRCDMHFTINKFLHHTTGGT